MSESSGSDLALAFRSFERRYREAVAPLAGEHHGVDAYIDRFHRAIAAAANALNVAADPAAVAESLAGKRSAERDETTMNAVRAAAFDAGAALRDMHEIAHTLAGGDQ